MSAQYKILHLEIDGVLVEKVRVWGGKDNIQTAVTDFKRAYNLSGEDCYVFYLIAQSKMNKEVNDFVNNKL